MIKLKQLLCEDPDGITVNGIYYNMNMASHTFLLYDDIIDKKRYWIAYVYPDYRKGGRAILCENEQLESILNGDDNIEVKTYIDGRLGDFPSHARLALLLESTNRISDSCDTDIYENNCNGRLFLNKYFSFWDGNNSVVKNKVKIVDFLRRIGVNTNNVFIEDHTRDKYDDNGDQIIVMVPFNEFFGGVPHQELNAFEKAKLELAKKLHMEKGKLDKAVLDVIRSNPKDVETLYARLEDKFGMPLLQIKKIFKNVPLGKLVVKELKEYINKLNNV
jgi:hypothetical protein